MFLSSLLRQFMNGNVIATDVNAACTSDVNVWWTPVELLRVVQQILAAHNVNFQLCFVRLGITSATFLTR